jgi:hypothetical protein
MTALHAIYGPNPQSLTMSPGFTDHGTIDATGEKIAWCGRFWHPDGPGTYEITRIHFRWGSVITKAGGSALTLSLQDVDLTAGAPLRPDGTPDQTVAIANGSIGTAGTWFRSGALSANRSLNYGDLVSAVLEFDGAGRLGSDLIRTGGPTATMHQNAVDIYTGSWNTGTFVQPNVAFECSDGTFGCLNISMSHFICSAMTLNQFNSGSTPDERALALIPPVTMTIDAISGFFSNGTGTADFDVVIYQGTTAIHTQSIDGNAIAQNDSRLHTIPLSSEVTLTAATQYYIALKPTTTNNCRWYYATIYNGEMMRLHGYPATTGEATRTNAGSWSAADTTLLPLVCLHICDVAGSGGGVRMVNVRGGADQ